MIITVPVGVGVQQLSAVGEAAISCCRRDMEMS